MIEDIPNAPLKNAAVFLIPNGQPKTSIDILHANIHAQSKQLRTIFKVSCRFRIVVVGRRWLLVRGRRAPHSRYHLMHRRRTSMWHRSGRTSRRLPKDAIQRESRRTCVS